MIKTIRQPPIGLTQDDYSTKNKGLQAMMLTGPFLLTDFSNFKS